MIRAKHVYFFKPIGFDGPIKIGCSESPMRRMDVHVYWSPWPLELIGSVPGDFEDERFLHNCFFSSHMHHEWFQSSPKLRRAIDEILAAGSVAVVKTWLAPEGSVKGKISKRRIVEAEFEVAREAAE